MKNRNKQVGKFFNSVADTYDMVHLEHIDGGLQSKIDTVKFIPNSAIKILDLGAGTGLELEFIFDKNKNAEVDCVDISQGMLDKLKEKYRNFRINIFCQDYFKFNFQPEKYDAVLSIMSFHHFSDIEKEKLYQLIFSTLTVDGVFVCSDYCAKNKEEEKFFRRELKKLMAEKSEEVFSYDIPTYPKTDIDLLKKVGFSDVEIKWQNNCNVCITAYKK